jgi:uncharacterized glyoxalase superfamily protein PhnB
MSASTPTVIPTLSYRDAAAAIDWLCNAFGFERHAVYEGPDDTVLHAELRHRTGMVMLGSAKDEGAWRVEPGTGAVYVVVDDVDAHCAHARNAGAEILQEPIDQDYGSRDYIARDLEGNLWSFGTYSPAASSAEQATATV